MPYTPRSKNQIAQLIADDLEPLSYVNLGIGLPTLIANFIPSEKEIQLHSENGILGMGPAPTPENEDLDLINAGKQPITINQGGAYFHHGDSFAMMRGGHIDYCVLGAYQVSQQGDLANWSTGDKDAIPAVGGAMDLAIGAKNVWVMTSHTTKDGSPKIMKKCSYPITGLKCVKRIYTDLCTIYLEDEKLKVKEIVPGLSFEKLQSLTDAKLENCL